MCQSDSVLASPFNLSPYLSVLLCTRLSCRTVQRLKAGWAARVFTVKPQTVLFMLHKCDRIVVAAL